LLFGHGVVSLFEVLVNIGLTQNRPSGVQAPRRTKCTVFGTLPCWNTFA